MLKVMLADDEPMDATFIEKSLDWNGLGLQIVGTAADGQMAIDMEEALRPDIIITDLIMPSKNGTEFIAEVLKKRPGVRVIFISGHKNFEYAQFGMEHAVDSYLLKPITPARLREAVASCADACLAARKRVFEQQTFQRLLDENMPKLRHIFLSELIRSPMDPADIEQKLKFFGITLDNSDLCAIVVRYDEPVPSADVSRQQLTQFQADMAIAEITAPLPNACAFALDNEEHVLLLNCTQNLLHSWGGLLAQSVIRNIRTMCALSVTAGVGAVVNGYGNLPVSYRTARAAADYRFFTGKGQAIFYADIVENQNRPHIPSFVSLPRDEIVRSVVTGDEEDLRSRMQAMLDQLQREKVSSSWVRNLCVELVSSCINAVSQINESVARELSGGSQVYNAIIAQVTLQDIISCVTDFLVHLCRDYTRSVYNRHSQIADTIRAIVERRLSEQDLSVEGIAEEIYLSRGYATQVFRKATGESISRYLIGARMKRARELLRNPALRIIDVARSVGYDNATYFSSIFKNETGVSPKEYRRRNLDGANASRPETGV